MRLCLFLLLLSMATASAAQDTVPDPTPPHRYYPLAVGNVWEYASLGTLPSLPTVAFFTRREVVRDTVLEGTLYFVVVSTGLDPDGLGWRGARSSLLRYDSTTTQVRGRVADGRERPIACRFGADFGGPQGCGVEPNGEFPDGGVRVEGGLGGVIPFGYGSGTYGLGRPTGGLAVEASKMFVGLGIGDYCSYSVYAAPIGYVGEWGEASCNRSLTYARVLQDDGSILEVGRRYAVASEEKPGVAGLTLFAHPNPTAGPLAVVIDGAREAVTLEAFDALGRRVWHAETHRQREELDASGWAPGLYIVRARAAGETATATIVRR